ncbi:reverse transcriptase domain-containing protein [Tanacetum coccineum]
MLVDIQETFKKLREFNMKLNPGKCSFGVEERPFLGHLIMRKGIKANPSKLVSWTLQGAKLEYPRLEKLILALIYAARRLQRYFQAYPIRLLIDKSIQQILARPKNFGRIPKWAIELREHDIKFRGRNSVKGHILADFLAKTPLVENKEIKADKTTNEEPEPENT